MSILTEVRDQIMILTLNRPEKKNALTHEMYRTLDQALAKASADPAIRVVLLTGAGSDFTGGNDLHDFATMSQGEIRLEDQPVVHLIHRVVTFEKPLVAAVKGLAVGFGTTVLLHCDVVVVGRSALLSTPFVQLGLVPEFGSSLLLPQLIGRQLANRALLLNEPISGEEAWRIGLAGFLCDDADVETLAIEKCRKLAQLPANAVRATKKLLSSPELRRQIEQTLAAEFKAFAEGLQSPEHQAALVAFFEKRRS